MAPVEVFRSTSWTDRGLKGAAHPSFLSWRSRGIAAPRLALPGKVADSRVNLYPSRRSISGLHPPLVQLVRTAAR
jgi:hypothetical protein